jgi:hypothetical protein
LRPARGIHGTAIAAPIVGGAGQHPTIAALGQLATGHIRVAIHGVESSATTATAAAAGTTAAKTTTTAAAGTTRTTPSPTIAIATTPTTAPVIARIATSARLGPGHHVDDVVKIALLLGIARGRILAGQNAHHANISRPLAQDRQSLHESGQSITGDAHRGRHGLGLGPCAQIGRGGRFLGSSLGGRRVSLIGGRCLLGGLGSCLGPCLGRRLPLAAGARLGCGLGLRLRCGRGSRLLGWMVSPVGLQSIGSLPQKNPREFGDGLHERVLGVVGGLVEETRMNGMAL